jgi:hypothetical protein
MGRPCQHWTGEGRNARIPSKSFVLFVFFVVQLRD